VSTPSWDTYRARDRVEPRDSYLEAYSHIEGLCGEETALLEVPEHERTHEQHTRLHALEQELDRVFHHLHARHERRGKTT
jgi:hypothetical protein